MRNSAELKVNSATVTTPDSAEEVREFRFWSKITGFYGPGNRQLTIAPISRMLEDQEKVQNIILFVLEMKILIKNITKKLIAMSRLDFYSTMI